MQIIVTGGLGFIGSNFIRHLLAEDENISVTNIDAITYAGCLDNLKDQEGNPRYKHIKGFIQDKGFVEEVVKKEKPDAIINFAAETHVDRSIQSASPFIETNIIGTHTLLDIALKNKVGRFIQISTDEVYGSIKHPHKFKEDSNIEPNSPYSASKAAADHLVRAYNQTYGLNTIIIRCSNNYGPYQFPEKVVPYFVSLLLQNKKVPVYGDGLNIRDWIYVMDFCSAISLVLREGKVGEVYNVSGNSEVANIDLTKLILQKLNKSEDLIEYVKDRPGHDRRYAMDSSKLEKELGWKRKYTFDEALTETINWYKNNTKWANNRVKNAVANRF